jgi:chromosome segregation ATPase
MFRKIGIAALAVVAGMFILKSTHLGAYARTAWHKVRTGIKHEVPIEFQIDTIRQEVTQLMPDMRKNISLVARETIELQRLHEQVETVQIKLDNELDSVAALRNSLQDATATVSFKGRKLSLERAQDLLARKIDACKTCQTELKAKKDLLEAREAGLEAEREKLAGMKQQKENYEVQIAQLEAQLKTLRLAQARSNFQLDDSRLSRIKGMIDDVRSQMQVEEKTAQLVGEFCTDEASPPASTKPAKTKADVIQAANELLGDSPKNSPKLAESKK